jgi:dihydroorotate dehydrogenase electron transfer subunit
MFIARVVRRRTLCRAHFEIVLSVPSFPDAAPGQFVQALCRLPSGMNAGDGAPTPVVLAGQVDWLDADDGASGKASRNAAGRVQLPRWTPPQPLGAPLLRRPFSIGGFRRMDDHCEISLLGRVIGSGTEWLAALSAGDPIDLIGPLGRGFTPPARGSRALLVAGGVGLPPIRWLAEVLTQRGWSCEAIYGAQTRDLLPLSLLEEPAADGRLTRCAAEFAESGVPVAITTDDGSCGMQGCVTDCLARYLDDCGDPAGRRVYACGPEAMLRTTALLCAARGLACETAMERRMGCGMGTCQSCVVRVRDAAAEQGWRYALCCTEGPVFDAASVLWE